MNLGIVLAISDYGSKQNNLPGCKSDGKAIATIFKSDSKFDDVLVISENTSSGNVKNQLIEFINKNKTHQVDELVFYYTGHGDFSGNEFYFLLSDYDPSRKNQTTLENSELDNLLKALQAKVTVKIVDACHSGQAYIKDSASFDKYLNEAKSSFDKCYFMYSSQLEQYSYQDNALSFFTKSIVDAVKDHSSGFIRYKDVIDYVSDSFESNSQQTPFFVVQADFTEPFCNISQQLRESLNKITAKQTSVTPDDAKSQSLVERIKKDASRYCTEIEALNFFEQFVDAFRQVSLAGDLAELYECSTNLTDEIAINPEAIGLWLEKSEHQYFARPTYKNVSKNKRVPIKSRYANAFLSVTGAFGGILDDESDDSKFKTVTYTDTELSGYEITTNQDIKLIEVFADPIYPNIQAGKVFIVPFLSKTELRVFYSFVHLADNGWTERTIKQKIKWLTKAVPLRDLDYTSLKNEIIQGFDKHLIDPIHKAYEIKPFEQALDSNIDKKQETIEQKK